MKNSTTEAASSSSADKIRSALAGFSEAVQNAFSGTTEGSEHKEVDACMPCEHEKVIAELTDKNKTVEEKNKTIEAELKTIKEKPPAPAAPEAIATIQAELKVVKAENDALKAWKLAQEETEHLKRVQAVLDLRLKAGLLEPKDIAAATDAFKKLPNEALDQMQSDLALVQGKFDSLPSGPRARLIPSSVSAGFNPLQATVGDLVGVPLGTVKAAATNQSGAVKQ